MSKCYVTIIGKKIKYTYKTFDLFIVESDCFHLE